MSQSRESLWIAMSALWLDTELSDERLRQIAQVVSGSGLEREELDDVFAFELAPFLGANHRSVAGEWSGFDPDWVCREARARQGRRKFVSRIANWIGGSTRSARADWERVKDLAFGDDLD